MRRARVLLAVTVYNGRNFVPRCLRSAKLLRQSAADIDVLVLDDCSPEPNFSSVLQRLCARLGVHYYRSPRNLGIVRNVNLGLLAAVNGGYDYVIISNSDVVYGANTVDALVNAARCDARIGAVTAWSTNVSVYSLPNLDPDRHLTAQPAVDFVATALADAYGDVAIDVPAGISFSMLVPTAVVREVGLMDPLFGRGYCEETDWSLRCQALGYRVTLCPGSFVYHQGRGSSLAAGMLQGNLTTVPFNEAIVDHRYPTFRAQVRAFERRGVIKQLHHEALRRLLRGALKKVGHVPPHQLAGPLPGADAPHLPPVELHFGPRGRQVVEARHLGFCCRIALRHRGLDAALAHFANDVDARPCLPSASSQPPPQRTPRRPGLQVASTGPLQVARPPLPNYPAYV